MNWPLLELSMLLQGSDEPKRFCDDHRRNARGHRVANCTLDLGHAYGMHVDTHSGHRWEKK